MIEYIGLLILSIVVAIGYNFMVRKTSKLYTFISVLTLLVSLFIFSPSKMTWNTDPNLWIMIIVIFIGIFVGNRIYPSEKLKGEIL